MDISALVGLKFSLGDWWSEITGPIRDYAGAVQNFGEFLGILGNFASGNFSDLSSESSLAGGSSGSSE